MYHTYIIPVIPRFMRGIHGYPARHGRMDTPDKPGYDGCRGFYAKDSMLMETKHRAYFLENPAFFCFSPPLDGTAPLEAAHNIYTKD
jgi:hypothetical protein